jgi:diadenosine tetraphosphate (Ap4A) HIT family hydrolase
VLEGRVEAPGGTILDDGSWHVDHAIEPPFARGWLIVKPHRHVESLGELKAAEAIALGPLLRRLTGAVEQALGAERVYVCTFGETVRHVHFHVVPRTAEMPPHGPMLLPELFADGRPWGCSAEEAADAAARVRAALKG